MLACTCKIPLPRWYGGKKPLLDHYLYTLVALQIRYGTTTESQYVIEFSEAFEILKLFINEAMATNTMTGWRTVRILWDANVYQ